MPIGAAFGRMGWIPGNNMQATYDVSALPAGPYTFVCSVHPNMTGTLNAE